MAKPYSGLRLKMKRQKTQLCWKAKPKGQMLDAQPNWDTMQANHWLVQKCKMEKESLVYSYGYSNTQQELQKTTKC